MPTVTQRKGRKGAVTFIGQARVFGLKPLAKTFPTRKEARDWAASVERELKSQKDRGTVRRDVGQLTVADLIKEYLDESTTRAQRSFSDTQRLLSWWVNAYGNDRMLEFGVVRVRKARESLEKDRGPATVNRYVGAMRSAWNWGIAAGLIPDSRPWPKRLMLKEPSGRIRFLLDNEIDRLLKASEHDVVMQTAIVASIGTGIRQGELLRLEWKDLDLAGDQTKSGAALTVRLSKNGQRRAVHLPANVVDALKRLRQQPVVSPVHVFLNFDGRPMRKSLLETRWQKIREAAKLVDFHWHDLRHTCASILLQQGATLAQVGGVLGHKSPSMTQRYAHLVQGAPVTGHDVLNSKLTPRQQ
jgi:integrase